jgi:hypothetical protein
VPKVSFLPHQLCVVTSVTNPSRYGSRWRLHEQFVKDCVAQGVTLVTVEGAFAGRVHEVTQPHNGLDQGNPLVSHYQFRTTDEIWHKENLINLGVQRFPHDWKWVAWVDSDVTFLRRDWAVETIEQLQHFHVVQMFQTAIDLGPTGHAFNMYNGFGYSFAENLPEFHVSNGGYYQGLKQGGKYWHPGFAWAMRRSAWDELGGLMDFAILGAADHHMALSLVGEGEKSLPHGIHPNYRKHVLEWQHRAAIHIRQNLGYVPGTIAHNWHGKKSDRRYWDRWAILKKHNFNPERDLVRDYQGMWKLSNEGLRMRNDLRSYFRSRNEDSIDFE